MRKKEKREEKVVRGVDCEGERVKEEMEGRKEVWGKREGRRYKDYVEW